jgi:D-3-phosphoglycerate dehydrogenase
MKEFHPLTILVTTPAFRKRQFPPGFEPIYNSLGRKYTEDEVLEMIRLHKPAGILAGVEPLTRRVLEAGAALGLKVISRFGAGLDSVDLVAARELGIAVANTPDAPADAVAELAAGLMLCLARRIGAADNDMKRGIWNAVPGTLLKGKTVGVVGCGRIGTRVAGIMAAFGCRLLGFDPLVREHGVCRMTELNELLSSSDFVTIHAPMTAPNRRMIGREQLRRMKPGAYIVNTARGGLIDEDALYDALKENRIAGAALDCFEEEPYRGKLAELPNVLLSPHVGSAAAETFERMGEEALANLLERLKP